MRARSVATAVSAALVAALFVLVPAPSATASDVSSLDLLKKISVKKQLSASAYSAKKFPTSSSLSKAATGASKGDKRQLVPAREAWVSGARNWSAKTRKAFANDTAYRLTLATISASAAKKRGNGDPATWLPSGAKAKCEYAATWVAVKYRWRLEIDTKEAKKLDKTLRGCAKKASTRKAIQVAKPTRAVVVSSKVAKHKAVEKAVLKEINNARKAHGAKALKSRAAITKVARAWSVKQADKGKISHNPKYSKQIPKGWTRAGENVAYTSGSGTSTAIAKRAVSMWLKSPGHRDNILNTKFTHTGIGVAYSTKHGWFLTQNFSN